MPKTQLPRLLPVAVLAFGLALAGCDSGSDDDAPSIGGTYSGTQTMDGVEANLSLGIPETESGSFSFTGDVSSQLDSVTVSFPVSGSGTYDHPDVALTMSFTISGETTTGQVNGIASASGDILRLEDEEGVTLTLTRE